MSKQRRPLAAGGRVTEAQFLVLSPREQDALVAEKVMGLVPCSDPIGRCEQAHMTPIQCWGTGAAGSELRPYSTDIAAAWAVVEKLESDGWDSEHESYYSPSKGRGYRFGFRRTKNQEIVHLAFSDNLPLSLCLAALKAVGTLAP